MHKYRNPAMQTMNQLFLLGHVGKNTEVHNFPDGGRKATVSLCTNSGKGENKIPQWHTCIFYGVSADLVSALKKGDSLSVVGALEYRSWTDQSGNNRVTAEIKVADFSVIKGELGQIQNQSQNNQNGYSNQNRQQQNRQQNNGQGGYSNQNSQQNNAQGQQQSRQQNNGQGGYSHQEHQQNNAQGQQQSRQQNNGQGGYSHQEHQQNNAQGQQQKSTGRSQAPHSGQNNVSSPHSQHTGRSQSGYGNQHQQVNHHQSDVNMDYPHNAPQDFEMNEHHYSYRT